MPAECLTVATPDGAMPVWRTVGAGRFGLLVMMDIFGIRDELHRMCDGFADQGWTTLLPDLFHRAGAVSFPTDRPPGPEAQALNTGTTMAMTTTDSGALLEQVQAPARLAAVGYCMGARHALAAAVRFPERIGAVAMLHGGRLVTDGPDSPHLLIDRLRVPAYIAFAADDPTCPAEHQAILTEAFAANAREHGLAHRIERFDARHGWMFPERHCHDPAAAARANAVMLALFGAALAG